MSTSPIKRYNYERSVYRWLLARHPRQFEKEGLYAADVERAPLARKALYYSSWIGARKIIRKQANDRFERSPFFERFIHRGLQFGTRFSVEHLSDLEMRELGVCEDILTGRYFLAHFGLEDSPSPVPVVQTQNCVPGCRTTSRKRCAIHTEMHRRLWKTVSELVNVDIKDVKSIPRQIKVTKALKTSNGRTVTQVIIETETEEIRREKIEPILETSRISNEMASLKTFPDSAPKNFSVEKCSENDSKKIPICLPAMQAEKNCVGAAQSSTNDGKYWSETTELLDGLDLDILSSLL